MRRHWLWRYAVFFLIVLGVLIRAYRDMSRPEAWAYWKDQYLSPSLSATRIAGVDIDGSGHTRTALVVSGRIGAAAATWLHQKLDESQLAGGDVVLLSSPGGDLNQAIIMGEIIRARGLVAGQVLGYMTKMGVSSTVVEAMSQTRDVRWLGNQEALAMNLITDPVRTP
jgi:hypothetical protein